MGGPKRDTTRRISAKKAAPGRTPKRARETGKAKQVQFEIDPAFLAEVERFREEHRPKLSKTSLWAWAMEEFLKLQRKKKAAELKLPPPAGE